MGTVQIRPQNNCILMNAFISSKLNKITTFCIYPFPQNRRTSRIRAAKVSDVAQLKQNWLDPLTLPPLHDLTTTQSNAESEWVLGIDLDLSGALAVLKTDQTGCSAQVFDSPHLPVLVGKRVRKRLDAKSIVLLLRSLDALIGTTAYIGQSIPYPQDGKQFQYHL